jgi:Rieske 2Fe-2S family protein
VTSALTLPGRAYSSEELFREELERVFTRRWLCVGRAEQAAAAGEYFTVSLGDESVVLVRGEDGALRAFHNFCRHRGARLCSEAHGQAAGLLRCPYHGWSYGLDGLLRGAPHMRGTPGFELADYPLVSVPLREWEGFLFIHLGEQPEPFEEVFAPFLGRFAAWDVPRLRKARGIEYDVAANWKLVVENYSECYHCSLVHPALVRLSPADSGENDLTEGPFLGGYMELNEESASMTRDGRSARPPLGSIGGEDLRRVYYYSVFPNLLLSLHPDYVMAHYAFPVGARRTRVVCEWYFDPETLAAPGFDPTDAVEFWDVTNREDWRVCELTQLGVASRAYTPGPYARSEGLLWAFTREYLKGMGGALE